ncbi:tubulin-folding cofactor B-like [Eriocheir sinensis]|uniref:tubulin-folding cofactor B-like n=1 Tax=Eriocheir sinensis TaxID=95602 RepID=UPI0021C64C45|nr:tubulin-folding cofactor B-like [Eriocheir sinensis]XP_050702959.1 tubulin-folding cofactor B-like [Eriocheir sinensis]XP_050702960.1 tubulin-folding cofactor B-like [Eriocheir sinensis]
MEVTVKTAPLVNVRVTSNVNNFTAEKRFDRALTIGDLKGRLELVTGGSASSMGLEVFDENESLVCRMDNDEALLGSFCVEENYRIHVTDSSKRQGEFEDLSKVEKYELSQEEYSKRDDSVRSFLLKNKLGKYNEEELKKKQEEKEAQEKEEEEKAKSITVGSRCQVRVQGEPTRRGEVMFVGRVHFKPGLWVGVKYDEPLGKNDGSIGGKRYFDAAPKYGGFTRPAFCEVGDFPPMDEEEEEEDEM